MKNLIFVLVLAFAAFADASPLVVCDRDASAHVRFAAFDLARHLKLAVGSPIAVVEPDDPRLTAAELVFEVGTRTVFAAVDGARLRTLGINGWLVVGSPGRVRIAGNDRFGTAYGVYELLEKRYGCRWYTPFDPPVIPKRASLDVGSFELAGAPALKYRWIHALGKCAAKTRDGSLFCFRNKLNVLGGSEFSNVELPEGCGRLTTDLTIVRCAHSLFALMPPHGKEGYFAQHPEWYTYSRELGRRVDNRQLCFSDPLLRRQLATNLLASVDAGRLLYSVSAEDVADRLCECERCLELEKRYGTRGAPLFAFLAGVSKLVAAKNPEALVSTLAYRRNQTQVPPNDAFPRFDDNVVSIFAPLDNDISKDMLHPNNRATFDDLKGWCAKSANVWAWYYPVPYFDYSPFGGALRFARDLQLMHGVGLNGACYEHTIGLECGTGFYDMYTWMLTKLFADVSLDAQSLMREFCAFAYGAASERMYNYACELERVREEYPTYTFGRMAMSSSYTAERLIRWSRDFDEMERLTVADAKALQRVREARLGLDMRLLMNYDRVRHDDTAFAALHTPAEIRERGIAAANAASARRNNFRGYMMEYDKLVKCYREHSLIAEWYDRLVPERFRQLPPEALRQSFEVDSCMGCRPRPMADAALGRAVWDDEEPRHADGIFPWCIYDDGNERYLARGKLTSKDVSREGEFTLLKLARVTLDRRCSVVLGKRWGLKYRLNDFYESDGNNEWDIYVSAKLEGADYFAGSTNSINRVMFDRIMLVRPNAK